MLLSVASFRSLPYPCTRIPSAHTRSPQDADVYRIYPVKAATTRNLLYALRFQPIIAEAVDIVRGMRLDVLHPAPPTLVASTGAAPGAGPHPAFFGTATPTTPAGAEPGAVEALASSGLRRNSGPRAGALLRSPTLLSQRQPSSSTLRLTRGSVGNGTMNGTLRPDEVYVAACQHLLYALHELLLWQAGDIDADGEIQRRDGVPLFAFLGGDDGSVRLYASDHLHGGPGHQDMPGGTAAGGGGNTKKGSMFTSASVAGGGASSCASSHPSARGRDLMEKDEDSFDRDMTWRRRELLRDTHVVEQLLMFISVAFQLYRGRTYARTREELLLAAARGDTAAPAVVAATEAGAAETAGADAVPDAHLLAPDAIPLIDACCRYAYRLLRVMMTSSCALTVLYLAGVNSMVRHISLGWDPPIEEILAAAIGQDRVAPTASKPKGAANNSSATTSNRLSCSDLYQLVLELYASYMKKEITGVKFLKLLANVRRVCARYVCHRFNNPHHHGHTPLTNHHHHRQQITTGVRPRQRGGPQGAVLPRGADPAHQA